uniref:G_PROTEIN_RECEP_F1_2 domain-containing protein n=1 Tax=Ascaris lumbricoides TaxID=6252 RepID=A0A0M3HVK6_ASCLU
MSVLLLAIVFATIATLTFLANLVSLLALLCRSRWANMGNEPSRITIYVLLSINIALSVLLVFPTNAFITSRFVFFCSYFLCNQRLIVDIV